MDLDSQTKSFWAVAGAGAQLKFSGKCEEGGLFFASEIFWRKVLRELTRQKRIYIIDATLSIWWGPLSHSRLMKTPEHPEKKGLMQVPQSIFRWHSYGGLTFTSHQIYQFARCTNPCHSGRTVWPSLHRWLRDGIHVGHHGLLGMKIWLGCLWYKSWSQGVLSSSMGFMMPSITLLGTNISPFKAVLKMMFLFQRWDMLVPWRLCIDLLFFPFEDLLESMVRRPSVNGLS